MAQDQKRKTISTRELASVGVMAALIFASIHLLKVTIPTPAGPVMIKLSNTLCLLAGMLFGGVPGGLAAGIGGALYDLTDPLFVASAPFTFVFYFIMAYLCGRISHGGSKPGGSIYRNVAAAACGAYAYSAMYIIKSVTVLVLEGGTVQAALLACSTKMMVSLTNATVAVVLSVLIAPVCRSALARAGIGASFRPA